MKMYVLTREQNLAKPVHEVFAFFREPGNLQNITPPSLGFRILTPLPVRMKEGALIDYTVRLAGIPVRWTAIITTYDPPRLFVDEQLHGPYSFWHHTHRFEESEAGTRMTDEVRYVLPFGVLGRIAHWLFVRRQLEHIFAFRSRVIHDCMAMRPENSQARST